MNEYRIIDAMEMQGKLVTVLDKPRDSEEYNKTNVNISGTIYSYLPTHNERSIIIDTVDDIVGKTLHFE